MLNLLQVDLFVVERTLFAHRHPLQKKKVTASTFVPKFSKTHGDLVANFPEVFGTSLEIPSFSLDLSVFVLQHCGGIFINWFSIPSLLLIVWGAAVEKRPSLAAGRAEPGLPC